MSFTKLVRVFKDSDTFILNEADLTGKPVGKALNSPKRDVPRSERYKWWMSYYPAGYSSNERNHLSVFLKVNKPMTVKCTFKVDSANIQKSFTTFANLNGKGIYKYLTHETLRPLFVDGQLSITCEVELEVPVPFMSLKPCLVQFSEHVPTDFALVVDSERVQVHKGLLSLMSPVFHAMLTHDTTESRNGEVVITDFDCDTVKTVIDFCYGRKVDTTSVETVFNILRFADKYDIKAVTSLVEKLPQQCLSIDTFVAIVRYADDCLKDELYDECCSFFKEHQSQIVKHKKFTVLAPHFIAKLLKKAFGLKTQFDVLLHADASGMTYILDPLEQPILESLSLETFCPIVNYAWECSRDKLKKACVNFFNEHLCQISVMPSFVELPPFVIQGLMKERLLESSNTKSIKSMASKTVDRCNVI
uniref:BTB domain-containing protein n=1 Tax=Panagrellus redivivus TaxID=6233 RepID=A0A7E4VTM3_PANRE